MKKLNQRGFEALSLIIIAAVVIVIAASGWYVYKHRQTNNKAQTAANDAEISNGNTGAAVDGFLDIPELGIQLKLGNGVTDATYAALPDGAGFGVSTKALEQQFGESCNAASGNVASIAVFVNSNGPNFGTGSEANLQVYPEAFKSADGTYYALNYSPIKQSFCGDAASNQQAADALQKQVVDGFSKTKVQQLK